MPVSNPSLDAVVRPAATVAGVFERPLEVFEKPLQSFEVTLDASLVGLLVLLVGVAVGTIVVYQAYRGFRRNASRPMLFLAVGLLLLGPVHFLLSLLSLGAFSTAASQQVVDVLGLLVILYSLTRA
jgi:hypothetical protein